MTSKKRTSSTSKNSQASVAEAWNSNLQLNYGTPELMFLSGKGAVLTDSHGKKYLDFLAGIATNALGHAHPAIVRAVTSQVKKLSHVSNLYAHEGGVELASQLKKMTGDSSARIFFCNSGTEANEAAFKIARLTGRKKIVSTIGGFHGRTAASLSLTGQPSKQKPFLPLISKIAHVPFGDITAMRKVVNRKVAMVIVEPIQGENGVVTPPADYLKELRKVCDENGALLCIDAVQTGMGRTGEWFGYEHAGIKPDIITLAKGLGGGLPLGAMITLGANVPHFAPGDHGSTFGGNPISIAASLATIATIQKNDLMKSAVKHEKKIKKFLHKHPGVADVRGKGLLLGIVLNSAIAKDVAAKCQSHGLLVNAPNQNVIRIAPPLIVSNEQVEKALKIISASISEVMAEKK